MELTVRDPEINLCWILFCNDSAAWTPEAMAAEAGLSAAAAAKAMKALAAAKLLKRLKNGSYRCPMAGAMIEHPHGNTVPELQRKFTTLRDALISSGQMAYRRRGFLRASANELTNYFPQLSLSISTAETYAITEKQKDSAIFAVECRVVKIRDF